MAQQSNDGRKFGWAETIQKEMGDDQVVVRGFGRREVAHVAIVKSHAIAKRRAQIRRTACGEFDHFAAEIDKINFYGWVVLQQAFQKTAVSIPAEQRSACMAEVRKVMKAGAFEKRSERKMFEDAVERRECIAVHREGGCAHGCTRAGSVNATSAAISRATSASTRNTAGGFRTRVR